MAAYTGYAIEFVGMSVILPVSKQDFMFENDISHESLAGSRHARVVTKKSTKPKMTFTTKDIQKALTAVTTEGIVVADDKPCTRVNIYQVSLDINGLPKSTGHRKIGLTRGAAFCKQLTAKSGEDCELEIEVHGLSPDGLASPVEVESGTLPAFPAAHERFGLGPLEIGSVSADELTSVTIDFGIKPDGVLTGSAIAPTQLQVESVLPTIEFESNNASLLDDATGIEKDGTKITSGLLFLRQRDTDTGAYLDDGDSEHFKIAFQGFATIDTGHTSDGNKLATVKGSVKLFNDGTNSPLVYSANQAIS